MNVFPLSASSTAATTPVSSIAEYEKSIPSSNRKTNKVQQQPTTSQVLKKYLASKKTKLESPSDYIGVFFVAMKATIRKLPPIFKIGAKAKISIILKYVVLFKFKYTKVIF